MMKAIRLLLLFGVVPALANAGDAAGSDEVLKQLAEIRDKLTVLQAEVAELKADVKRYCGGQEAKRPAVPREVAVGDLPMLGNPQAQVAILEYSDYECPFCRRHHRDVMPQLRKHYIDTGKVRYVMREYPLRFHRHAAQAAAAARCAARQDPGKYWQLNDRLFAGGKLDAATIATDAAAVGLDAKALSSCMAAPETAAAINADMRYGQAIGVNGTPAFYVGRLQDGKLTDVHFISGAQPYPVFAKALDQLLQR